MLREPLEQSLEQWAKEAKESDEPRPRKYICFALFTDDVDDRDFDVQELENRLNEYAEGSPDSPYGYELDRIVRLERPFDTDRNRVLVVMKREMK